MMKIARAAQRRGSWAVATLLYTSLGGCSLNLVGDIKDLEDDLDKALEDLENIEICDGMSLGELKNSVTISDDCKAQLESYLPQPEDDFSDRLIVMGSLDNDDGSLSLFVQGVDGSGDALRSDDWQDLHVTTFVDGDAELLLEGDFTLTQSAEFSGDLLSIGFVNDYSGSMSEADLRVTAEIEESLLEVIPDVFEGEVTLFSTEVTQKQAFTEDRDDLSSAVAYDETFERDLTALYDGMGQQLASLVARDRPLRLLVVATDGAENSSQDFRKAELVETIEDNDVCVLILGSLFSEPSELEDLSGNCGAYFYTPSYGDLDSYVSEYIASLSGMVRIDIPEELRGEGPLELAVGSLSAQIDID